jgi:hypothetical protein
MGFDYEKSANLAGAEESAGSHPGGTNTKEAEFLRSSLEAEKQLRARGLEAAQRAARAEAAPAEEAKVPSKLRRRAIASGGAVVMVILLGMSIAVWRVPQEKARIAMVGGRPVARADEPITIVALSRDNRWVITGENKTVCLWDLRAHDPVANPVVLRGHDRPVSAVAISHDSRWVVTGSWDKTVRLWDLSALANGWR